MPTGYSPREAGEQALERLLRECGLNRGDINVIIGTGYGRVALSFIDKAVTEITCHARGAHYLVEGTDMVIDIGGQDSKVILTDGAGNVTNFVMNDKCAAGTGRFLQVMATALGCDVSELAGLARGAEPAQISSMCTVFAESEVVSLIARGEDSRRVALGLHQAIVDRVCGMIRRVGIAERFVFAGGVAHNPCLQRLFAEALGVPLSVPPDPQIVGALGAALHAAATPRPGTTPQGP
jgi:predicted CoA-substrate-specific enzyme activase